MQKKLQHAILWSTYQIYIHFSFLSQIAMKTITYSSGCQASCVRRAVGNGQIYSDPSLNSSSRLSNLQFLPHWRELQKTFFFRFFFSKLSRKKYYWKSAKRLEPIFPPILRCAMYTSNNHLSMIGWSTQLSYKYVLSI